MNFKITDDQRMTQNMAREFARKEVAPLDAAMDRSGEFPTPLMEKMKSRGFLGLILPREYQGGGAGALAGALTIQELAQAGASVALTLGAHWLAASALVSHGSAEQKARYLPRAAADTWLAFCLTESGAGSDAAGIKSTAERDGADWILNGDKAWVTNGGMAGIYVVLARTDKTLGAKGLTVFIVEDGAPGLTVGRQEDKMGMRGSQTTALRLNGVRVGDAQRLGGVGQGFKIAMTALDGGRINMAALAVGLTEAALAAARSYAARRLAFGRPLAELEAVQFKIADMVIGLEAAKLLTFQAAALKDDGRPHTRESALAKVFGSGHAVKSCLEAIQILGGNGYSREYAPERLLRDAKLLEIGEGATEVLKMILGRAEPAAAGATEFWGGAECPPEEAAAGIMKVLSECGCLGGRAPAEENRPEKKLTEADLVVAIGRGASSAWAVGLAHRLAKGLGGALGVTRPLVHEAGFAPSAMIGQSGVTVRPQVILNFGLSGAAPYTVGMSGAVLVIAVNHDPDAPIFGLARYGAVSDAEKTLECLVRAVEA